MKSQKEICFEIISGLRDQGKSDMDVVILGSSILLDRFKMGEWEKTKGSTDDPEILRYSRDLIKNWIKKDPRLNGGEKYTPKNPRGPRNQTSSGGMGNLRDILNYLKDKDPTSPLIIEIEEKIMWEESQKKVG